MKRTKRKQNGRRLIHQEYASVADMVQSTREPSPVNQQIWDAYFVHTHLDVYQWLGCGGFAEVDRLVSHGWLDGLKRVEEKMNSITVSAPTSVKRRKMRDRFGDEVDIHAVYAGNLDRAWTRTTRHPITAVQAVTLYVDISANGAVGAEELFWRGAAGIIICDALESAGYSVKVVAYDYSVGSFAAVDYDRLTTVVVKEAQQPLNKILMASVTALAGFFRKYQFASQLIDEWKCSKGFGRSVTWSPEPETGNELVFNVGKVNSPEAAQALVNQVVGKLEGEFDR